MVPRNVEQNQKIRDERKEQILESALKAFAQKGLASTKISDIAQQVGLSHGLIYHYFKSKDDIFTELIKTAIANSTNIFKYILEMDGTPLERIQNLTEVILTQAFQNDGPYYFYLMIQAFTSEAVPEAVKKIIFEDDQANLINYLLPVLIEGQKKGQIVAEDPVSLAITYLALIQGLAISQMQNNVPLPTTEMVMRLFKHDK